MRRRGASLCAHAVNSASRPGINAGVVARNARPIFSWVRARVYGEHEAKIEELVSERQEHLTSLADVQASPCHQNTIQISSKILK